MSPLRILCALILLAMGAVLGVIGFQAVARGRVRPFRMQRWTGPDEVERDGDPLTFWFWVSAHWLAGAAALVAALLTFSGQLELR